MVKVKANSYPIYLNGSIEDMGHVWILIGKKIYEKILNNCEEEDGEADAIMAEMFSHVLNNREEKKEMSLVYWN